MLRMFSLGLKSRLMKNAVIFFFRPVFMMQEAWIIGRMDLHPIGR